MGFERAGMECRWQVELDKDCRSVLTRHWPTVKKRKDVRACGKKNLEHVDVICFGSPCQDLSVAGRREGLGGKKSVLFFEACRVVRELRPSLVVFENVPGLFSSNDGHDFLAVLKEFQKLGASDIAWRVCDARYFGVAQRRRRVFLVADFGGERAGEVLFESACGCGDAPPRGQAGAQVAGTLGGGSAKRGWNDDFGRSGTFVVGGDTARCDTSGSGKRYDLDSEDFVVIGSLQSHSREHGHAMTTQQALESGQVIPFVVNAAESTAKKFHARKSETARCLDQTGGFASNQGGTVVAYNVIGGGQQSKRHAYPTETSGCLQGNGLRASGNSEGLGVLRSVDGIKGTSEKKGGAGVMAVRRLTPL